MVSPEGGEEAREGPVDSSADLPSGFLDARKPRRSAGRSDGILDESRHCGMNEPLSQVRRAELPHAADIRPGNEVRRSVLGIGHEPELSQLAHALLDEKILRALIEELFERFGW